MSDQLTHEDVREIVRADLDGLQGLGWEQYADEMWEDRLFMFHRFPSNLSFPAFRALVRRVAKEKSDAQSS